MYFKKLTLRVYKTSLDAPTDAEQVYSNEDTHTPPLGETKI